MFRVLCVILLSYSSVCSLCSQDLLTDINVAYEKYTSSSSYVFDWTYYTLEDPGESEQFIMKKCYNHFLLKGGGQIMCTDGKYQITLDESAQLAYFGPMDKNVKAIDPITRIMQILDSSYSTSFISDIFGIRKYNVKLYQSSEEHLEISFDSNRSVIKKVIQFFDNNLNRGIVFELNSFNSYCDGSNEVSLDHYLSFNSNHEPLLSADFINYTLLTANR